MRQVFVVLGMVGIMGLAMGANGGGCAHGCTPAQTNAWKQCEVGQIPTTSQEWLVDVTSILSSMTENWQAALMDLAARIGRGQVDCLVAAVKGEFQKKADAYVQAELKGRHSEIPPSVSVPLSRANEWLRGAAMPPKDASVK